MFSVILLNIIFIMLLNNVCFFYLNSKKMKVSKGAVLLWGIISTIFGLLCLYFSKPLFSFPTILLTGVIGTIINLKVRGNLKLQKIYIRSLSVLFLFFLSTFFQYIPVILFSIDLNSITTGINTWLSLFSSTCLLLILLFLYQDDLSNDFKLFKKDLMKHLDIGFKYWFLGLFVMIASNVCIQIFLPQAVAGNEAAVQAGIHVLPLVSLMSTGFLAPIIEEITFRKTFRDMISNNFWFVIISGFVFGSLHVFLSNPSIYDLFYLIPYCSIGFAFGMIYVKSENIFASISVHMIHNIFLTLFSIISALVVLC